MVIFPRLRRLGSPLEVVTASTRERVLDAIAKLDYWPDAIARSLKISRTNTIGLILPSIESPSGRPWRAPPMPELEQTVGGQTADRSHQG